MNLRSKLATFLAALVIGASPVLAADLSQSNWSQTDASNNSAAPNGFPEGMAPSGVNDAARAVMGAVKRFWDRANATLTTAGSSTAYTLTYAVAPPSYVDGELYTFEVDETNTGATTLNINALGAIAVNKLASSGYVALAAGDWVAGQRVIVQYDSGSTTFRMVSSAATEPTASSNMTWTGTHTFSNTVSLQAALSTTAAINFDNWETVASATTTDLGAATSNLVTISGTNTITSFGTTSAGVFRIVRATGAFVITQSANIVGSSGETSGNHTATVGQHYLMISQGGGVWNFGVLFVRNADQATIETGTNTTFAIPPGRAQFHNSAAKAWCMFDGTVAGTNACTVSYNVTDTTRVATGRYTINFSTNFSSANYVCVGMSESAGTLRDGAGTQSAGAFPLRNQNSAGTAADDAAIFVVCYGDQ